MQGSKLIHMGAVLILSVLLTPSAAFSYTVLWDTSHGVADSGEYQPSGYYQTLTQHLSNNDFTVDTTSDGFLVDDPAGYDVAVVCLTSAYYSAYSPDEVTRIVDFVNAGGGLLIMGDRQATPNANIQPIASQFGITFGVSDVVSEPGPAYFEIYTSEFDLSHPVFDGIESISLWAASELSVSEPASPVAWQADTGKAIVAAAQYNNGRVLAIGDSTLWAVNPSVINHYFYRADNPQFGVNTFTYLAVPEPVTPLLLSLGGLVLLRKRRA